MLAIRAAARPGTMKAIALHWEITIEMKER